MILSISRTRRARAQRTRRPLNLQNLECRLAPATLQGTVWQDLNANGVRDTGEPALAGRTVFLDTNGNRIWNTGEAKQTTPADGSYLFSVSAGSSTVVEELPTGWAHTNPRSGPVAPATVSSAAWKFIGPFGGDAIATAVSPSSSNVVLAAIDSETTTGQGGLYRSTDGGSTWLELPFFRDTQVLAIAYAANGDVYAGAFTGLYKSSNDGGSWAKIDIGSQTYQNVYAIGTHPSDANTLIVGLNPSSGQQPETIWRTTDGGATWTDVMPFGSSGMSPQAITFNPDHPEQVFIAYGGGFGGNGVFYSATGGTTWESRTNNLPSGPVWDVKFAAGQVFVAGGHPFFGQPFGVYSSSDLGQNWTSLSGSWPDKFARSVAVIPNNSSTFDIIVGTERDGVYQSTNGGATWNYSVGGTTGLLVYDVRFNGTKVLAATGGFGVLASTNGGASFNPSSTGMTEFETTSVAVNPLNANEMVLTYSRLNTGGVLRSTDGGVTWNRETLGGGKYNFAKFAADGRLFVAASIESSTGGEGMYRRETNGTWTAIGPNFTPGQTDSDVQAIAFDPAHPNVIVAVGQGYVYGATTSLRATVWRTDDGGTNWSQMYQSSATEATIVNDVEWLGNGQTLVATVNDQYNQVPVNGGVLRSADDGETWTLAGPTQAGLPNRFQGNGVAVAPSDPNIVYVANGYASNIGSSFTAYLYMSSDGGATWTAGGVSDSSSGMANPVVDPVDDRIVYASMFGTRVVRSVDRGQTWAPFDAGLDNAAWFYGHFAMNYVNGPTPHIVVSTNAGIYSTEVYTQMPGVRTVSVLETSTLTGLDFGSRPLPGEISGTVWEDADGNGQFVGEFGRSDQVVYLDTNNNSQLDVGEQSYKTFGSGEYRFTGLDPSTYIVRLALQPATIQTLPLSNGAYTVTVSASGSSSGKNIGFQIVPASFHGTKFNDLNGNHVQDTGEPGLHGWTIYLDLNANGALDQYEPSTSTDAQGHYTLSTRDSGTYLVAEIPAPYWTQSSPASGTSVYDSPIGYDPSYGTWADQDDISTPNVIDIWYDFRNWTTPGTATTYTNFITPEQQGNVRAALDRWEQATGGKLKFTQNTMAPIEKIITIGTGDLRAVGYESGPGEVAGAASSGTNGPGNLGTGVAWMDYAENWDTTIGNGYQNGTVDYFSVALHEIGHAIGLAHAQGTPFTWLVVMAPTLSSEYTALSPLDVDEVRSLYGAADNRGGFYVVRGTRGTTRDNLDFGAVSTGTPPYSNLSLDVGVYYSTTPNGYQLLEYTTPYGPYTRFGWIAGTDRYGWHTGSGDPLLEDYVDTVDSTFAADLPTGTYDVTLTLGAPFRNFDPTEVSLEGAVMGTFDTLGNPLTQVFRNVSVVDGQLTARFRGAGGGKVAINAINIVKVADTLVVDVSPSTFSEAGGANVATGTVTRTGDMTQAVNVNLTSNDTSEATVPMSVTIPAGQSTATFPVSAVDDAIVDGSQSVNISATAIGYANGSKTVTVTDNDVPLVLTVAISPSTFSEGAGANAATATVTRTGNLSQPLTVNLSNSDTTEATVPATVTIPANQASVTFAVAAVDDTIVDGTQSATITAAASGFTNGTKTVSVTDNDVPLPVLTVAVNPSTFSEGAGSNAATGTVTRTGSLSSSLTVTLASSDTTEATVPTTVTFSAGQSSKTFTIAAVNDAIVDGTQSVTITATKTGYTGGSKTVSVTDNDVPLVLTVSATPNTFSEAAGSNAATGKVTRNGDLAFAQVVTLASNDTTEATVPTSVTIPAGAASATFAVRAIDDTIHDGTQTVKLTAAVGSVAGFTNVSVTDNDPMVFTTAKFDFGTSSSAVESGYQQVTSSTQYTSMGGFGWSSGNIGEVSRTTGSSNLNRDFNTSKDGTFSTNVQNGTYSVTLIIGDYGAAHSSMNYFLEGTKVASNVSTSTGQIKKLTFTVVVRDGQMTLRIQGASTSNPAIINGLEFTRTGN